MLNNRKLKINFLNPFIKELLLIILIDDLINANVFGVSRRYLPIQIGRARADTHSSVLKTVYGEAGGVIRTYQYT